MRALFLTDFLDSSFFPLGLEGMGFGASESMPGDGEDSLKDRDSGEPSCDTMSRFPHRAALLLRILPHSHSLPLSPAAHTAVKRGSVGRRVLNGPQKFTGRGELVGLGLC